MRENDRHAEQQRGVEAGGIGAGQLDAARRARRAATWRAVASISPEMSIP